jgi:hypothetical protein
MGSIDDKNQRLKKYRGTVPLRQLKVYKRTKELEQLQQFR